MKRFQLVCIKKLGCQKYSTLYVHVLKLKMIIIFLKTFRVFANVGLY